MKKIMVLMLIVIMLFGCQTNDNNIDEGGKDFDPIVKVGLIVPVTGKVAVYGQSAEKGAKLALDEYNAKGGVLGRQVEMVVYDNKADPDNAVKVYTRMKEGDNVDVLVGGVISSTTLKIAPLAQIDGMPLITPTGTHVDITKFGNAIFRACYTDEDQGRVMSQFASESLKAESAVVLYNQEDDYSTGLAEAFKETFLSMGGDMKLYYGYSESSETQGQMELIQTINPDVIFLPDYYSSVIEIATMIENNDIETILLGGDGWDAVASFNPLPLEGGYFANHFSANDPSAMVQGFVKAYREKYEDEVPNAYAAMGYEAMSIVLESIVEADTTDQKVIVEAMAKLEHQGITGKYEFDEDGNSTRTISIIKIKDGKEVLADKY